MIPPTFLTRFHSLQFPYLVFWYLSLTFSSYFGIEILDRDYLLSNNIVKNGLLQNSTLPTESMQCRLIES